MGLFLSRVGGTYITRVVQRVLACVITCVRVRVLHRTLIFRADVRRADAQASAYLATKSTMIKTILLTAAIMAAPLAVDKSAALAFCPGQPASFVRHQLSARTTGQRMGIRRFETTKDDDDNSAEVLAKDDTSLFDQINAFLDTPILDANDRSDQGAVAETLKRFVRREPQIASIAFSAVVVAFMFLLVRIYNFILYGI